MSPSNRLMWVHGRARVLAERFGHEGGGAAFGDGDLFDDVTEGHHVVGHGEGVGVAQVDLLLTGGALVVGELDGDTHRFEGFDGVPAEVRCGVVDGLIE